MQKINFQDYPNTTTPISASNLNTLQNNVEDAINLTNLYSTDETIVGSFLEKPCYRKVYNFGALPNTTSKTINSNLSDIKIIKIYGYAVANNNTTIPLPYASITTNFMVSLNYTSDNKINIETGTDRTEYNGYVIIEYTKNAD